MEIKDMEQGTSLQCETKCFFFHLIHNQFFVDPDDLVRDGQKNKQGELAIVAVGYIGIDLFSHKSKKTTAGQQQLGE